MQAAIQQAVSAAVQTMPQPQAAPEPQPIQLDSPYAHISDEDLIDGRTVKAMATNFDQRFAQFANAASELYKGQTTVFEQNSRLLNPKIWDKYSNEIQSEIESIKQTKIVTADDYDRAIAMVKGRHIDDFLEEKVQQAMQNAPPGDPGAPGVEGAPMLNQPQIPESWQKYLQEAGLTLRDVQAMLDRRRDNYGHAPTLEEYFKQMEQHQIIKDEKAYKAFDLIPEKAK